MPPKASRNRLQQISDLASCSPDVIRTVRDGTQPTGLTSDWLIRLPPIWTDRRYLCATL